MPDSPYDWLPSYPHPAYVGKAGTSGTRTPISPMSAANSVKSLPRPGWAPSAPTSAYGSVPPSPSRGTAHPYYVPSAPYQHRHLQTPTRSARYSGSISSRGSFGVAVIGEVIERPEIVELPAQSNGQSLDADALRDLDQQHRTCWMMPPTPEPYNLVYGELSLGDEPPIEPKVLIRSTHRAANSQSSITPLIADHVGAVELPGSPPPVHRRSVPLMEAANLSLSSYGSYSFDEYDLAVELEGDGHTGPHELPTPHQYSARSASMGAGTEVGMIQTRHARNFSRDIADSGPGRALSGRNTAPEKGEWHLDCSSNERRKKWIVIGVVAFLVIAIIITATVGGVLG